MAIAAESRYQIKNSVK